MVVRVPNSLPVPLALIFDIGGVIIRPDVSRALEPLGINSQASAHQVWQAIVADPLWHDWQEGRVEPREWHRHLARRLRFSLSYEKFRSAWSQALDPATLLNEELFEQLKSRYRLALLSNTDPIHVAQMEEHFPFVRHFPVRVYSCEVGASKPSPAIYRRALEQTGVRAEQALYVDDIGEYVEAARGLGIQALHVESPEQLIGELRRRGILAP